MKKKKPKKYKAGAIDTMFLSVARKVGKCEVHFFYTFFEERKV